MTATITLDSTDYNYYSSFTTCVKAGLAGIGVTSGQIVYDASGYVIAKITNGTGTYADNYLRFKLNGSTTYAHSIKMGTGYTSGNDVTGGQSSEIGAFYATSVNKRNRYITADDGTFGVVQILNDSTSVVEGSYGFIKPTNTTETAADIPLVMGLGASWGNNTASGATYASLTGAQLRYWNWSGNTYVNVHSHGNLKLHFADAKKGSRSYGGLGQSVEIFGGGSSSSSGYFGGAVHSVVHGIQNNIDGSIPIIPNVPIVSGGVPIGYNSNLAFCPPNLNPGDNIVITSGSEEYTVISNDGIAIRRV